MKNLILSLIALTMSYSQLVSNTYLPLTGVKDAERLTILNEVYNPASIDFLKKMGITSGMNVLDVGSGIGLMSCQIANLVGPSGHVTCLDVSPEQNALAAQVAHNQGIDNMSYLQLSAFDMGSLNSQFDCIYIRFLLMHVPNPERILENAYSLLKPNGKLIIEEPTGLQSIWCSPMTKGFQEYITIGTSQFKQYNTDPSFGCSLPNLLTNLGFDIQQTDLFHPVLATPRSKKLIRFAVNTLTPAMVSSGLYSEDEMQEISESLVEIEESSKYFVTYFEVTQLCAKKRDRH